MRGWLFMTVVVVGAIAAIVPSFYGVFSYYMKTEARGMKQVLFMAALVLAGVTGAIIHPIHGVLVYYLFAILRPQYLWGWALPGGVRWSLLAAGAAMLGCVISLPHIIRHARWNSLSTLLVLFGCLLLVSCFSAIDSAVSAYWGQEYAKIFLMAVIATLVIDRLRHIRWLSMIIVGCIVYVAWQVNSLYVFDGRSDIFHYGYGGLDNNGAALMLAMGLPFCYAFAMGSRKWMIRIACAAGALLIIHAIMLSYSRGAMVSALVGILWLLIHHRPRWQVGAISAVGLVLVLAMAGDEVRDRFLSVGNYDTDTSAQSRMDSWSAAWRITWDHPLTGVGIRNANLISRNYGADVSGRTIHSQYLQLSADSGILALMVYVSICVLAFVNLGRCRHMVVRSHAKDSEDDPESGPQSGIDMGYAHLALGMQASLLIFLFGGVFLSLEVFELPYLLMVAAGVYPQLLQRRIVLGYAPDEVLPELDEHSTQGRGTGWPRPRFPLIGRA